MMSKMSAENQKGTPKVLVFATEKISDPAIDLAGLLKLHYPPTVYVVTLPCSSAVKPKWIMHAFEKGYDGVFVAADGTDCPYSETCTDHTSDVIAQTHILMKEKGMNPARLKMAAICSVCAEPFAKHMNNFVEELSNN
ncbi:MAG: hydrogenase iron-sulfur subunit [Bacteroidales bacterium]